MGSGSGVGVGVGVGLVLGCHPEGWLDLLLDLLLGGIGRRRLVVLLHALHLARVRVRARARARAGARVRVRARARAKVRVRLRLRLRARVVLLHALKGVGDALHLRLLRRVVVELLPEILGRVRVRVRVRVRLRLRVRVRVRVGVLELP